MLWVRNGYVELTIILNHKNIQYMFTLPFLHTLPIIITNKETAFSDLVIFGWLLWGIDLFTKLSGKRRGLRLAVFAAISNVTISNTKRNLLMSWISDTWGPRLAHLSVVLTCVPARPVWSLREAAQGSSICNHYSAEGKVYGKGPGWDCGEDVPGADCSGEEKHSGSGQGTVHCCVARGMQGD